MSTGKLENVEFVSASAGSGKTFTLTEKMADMVGGNDDYKPENFILTTFTKAAAAEFKEKIRAKFYEKNISVEGLDNAVVGTIHSVAEQFIMQYWYLLGISPEISILTDSDKAFYMNQTLLQCVSADDMAYFNSLVKNFKITVTEEYSERSVPDYDFWKKDLVSLISSMVNYNISNWDEHCRASKGLLAELYGMPLEKEQRKYFVLPKKDDVKSSLQIVSKAFDLLKPTGRTTQQSIDEKRTIVSRQMKDMEKWDNKSPFVLKNILDVMLSDSINLKTIKKDPEVDAQFDFFETLHSEIYRAQKVYESIEQYIDKIFGIAKAWNERYEQYKKENQVMDFSDLEKYFKQLLEIQEVAEDISRRYKVVMVDEFQDCSPVQVAIFEKLAALVDKNIWVGDVKQAIYGFRGTDIDLIEGELKKIRAKTTLKKSWRSAKTLVDFANDIFSYSFEKHNGLEKDSVKLDVAEKNSNLKGEMVHWNIVIDNSDEKYTVLAEQISLLKESKNIQWDEIAVLARTNSEVKKIVKAIKDKRLPVNVLSEGSADKTLLDAVVQSVLAIAADKDNELSKAVLLQYLEGVDINKLILKWKSEDMKELAMRVVEKAHELKFQSVSDFVGSLFVELGLGDLLIQGGLGNEREVYSALQWYENRAKGYEQTCSNLNIASSLVGFLEELKAGGGCNPADDKGVTVATYHKSKGLEWRAVILWDLHKDSLKYSEKNVSGVKAVLNDNGYSICLCPSFMCSMMLHKGKDLLIDKDGYNLFHATNLKENVRLLYVGVTRAKQYLVTTTVKCRNSRVAHKVNRGVEWFASALNSVNLVQYNEAEKCLKITVVEDNNDKVIAVPAIECYLQNSVADGRPGKVCVLSPDCDKKEYQPLYLQSSKLKFSGNVELGEIVEFGSRADVSGKDNSKVGDCIHHFMQLYGSDREKNIGLLDDLAESYGVEIDSAAIEDNAEKFFDMMDEKFGPVQGQLRESPFTMDWKGNVVTGEIDLVYSTADGDVIVDYKSFAGKISNLLDKDNDHWAGKYAGPLDAYKNALKLSGRNVKAMWICYISLGVMVEVKIG